MCWMNFFCWLLLCAHGHDVQGTFWKGSAVPWTRWKFLCFAKCISETQQLLQSFQNKTADQKHGIKQLVVWSSHKQNKASPGLVSGCFWIASWTVPRLRAGMWDGSRVMARRSCPLCHAAIHSTSRVISQAPNANCNFWMHSSKSEVNPLSARVQTREVLVRAALSMFVTSLTPGRSCCQGAAALQE